MEIRLAEADLERWRAAAPGGDVSAFVRACVAAELERPAASSARDTLDELLDRVRA